MGRLMDIKLRRDTAANWTSVNPVLDAGEPGFETDTKRLKIGDGSTAWTSLGYAEPGGTELIYKYVVTGSDKATIDTSVDTAQAGSGDWANGDVLEISVQGRTDETGASSFLAFTFNNDTGNNYLGRTLYAPSATPSVSTYSARANIPCAIGGASSYAGNTRLWIPNYTSTTMEKSVEAVDAIPSVSQIDISAFVWFATPAAITRVAVTPLTAAKKMKVGTQLLIYKRRS